jgi:hypothetical protein
VATVKRKLREADRESAEQARATDEAIRRRRR